MRIPSQRCASPLLTCADAAGRTALAEAAAANVAGAAVTPFLLRRVAELTGGASLRANIALIKHNARVGAQIAAALAPMLAADK